VRAHLTFTQRPLETEQAIIIAAHALFVSAVVMAFRFEFELLLLLLLLPREPVPQ
jgi:hypothetical protein